MRPTATLRVGGTFHDLVNRLGGSNTVANLLRILLVLAMAFVVTRLMPRLSRRLVKSLQLHAPLRLTSPRADGRATTVGRVMASIFRTIVWLIAFLTILGIVNINLAPFVATATVIGAAVGFGAQSLVKDFLSGILILLEDQYGVGDSITVGDTTGTVEGLNLRTTRVRGLDGIVWFIANGEIRKVGNSSEGYNQAVVDIVVPPGTDLGRAEQLAAEESAALASEEGWKTSILEPPAVLGVQAVAADGVTLRVVARTNAGEHFRVARELRSRILERFRREGVAWSATAGGDGVAADADGTEPPGQASAEPRPSR